MSDPKTYPSDWIPGDDLDPDPLQVVIPDDYTIGGLHTDDRGTSWRTSKPLYAYSRRDLYIALFWSACFGGGLFAAFGLIAPIQYWDARVLLATIGAAMFGLAIIEYGNVTEG